MKKSYLKGIGIATAAATALGICMLGLTINRNRQQEQHVAYAETAISNEQLQLTELEETIAQFYADKEKTDFLKKDLTIEEINQTRKKLEEVRTTAADFKIKDSSSPPELQELKAQKAILTKQLSEISQKFEIQKQTNALFESDVKDWQIFEENMVIQETLEETSIKDIQAKIADISEDAWRKMIEKYLSDASEQLEMVKGLQTQLEELLKEEVVTQEAYDQLLSQIEEIRNPNLKEKWLELAKQVAEKIETVPSSEEIEESETSEEAQEETDFSQTQTPPANNVGSSSGRATSGNRGRTGNTSGNSGGNNNPNNNEEKNQDTKNSETQPTTEEVSKSPEVSTPPSSDAGIVPEPEPEQEVEE